MILQQPSFFVVKLLPFSVRFDSGERGAALGTFSKARALLLTIQTFDGAVTSLGLRVDWCTGLVRSLGQLYIPVRGQVKFQWPYCQSEVNSG